MPVTPTRDQLIFRKMGNDLDNRPFLRLRPSLELVIRHSFNQQGDDPQSVDRGAERVAGLGGRWRARACSLVGWAIERSLVGVEE
ncbi:MAG: hypothetical protein ABSF71_06320, partial [Terriglobia bacterium]